MEYKKQSFDEKYNSIKNHIDEKRENPTLDQKLLNNKGSRFDRRV